MARLDIPLPEISTSSADKFDRSWTYVATAKEWTQEKQLAVIPALLRGKLLDNYTSLSADEKVDMETLKINLAKRAGLLKTPVAAAKEFQEQRQNPQETVSSFLTDLKRLYTQAFPRELMDSLVLLQKFLSDLRLEISQQALLRGKPTSLEGAVDVAMNVEQVLGLARLEMKQVGCVEEQTTACNPDVKELREVVAAVTEPQRKEASIQSASERYMQDLIYMLDTTS